MMIKTKIGNDGESGDCGGGYFGSWEESILETDVGKGHTHTQ